MTVSGNGLVPDQPIEFGCRTGVEVDYRYFDKSNFSRVKALVS